VLGKYDLLIAWLRCLTTSVTTSAAEAANPRFLSVTFGLRDATHVVFKESHFFGVFALLSSLSPP
jgi:hypothetical protein